MLRPLLETPTLLSRLRRAIARLKMPSVPDLAGRQTYLLSLWRETPSAPWRAALRPAGSTERIGFADLEALALFLLRLDEDGERPVVVMDTGSPNDTMTR
jgi:hypothetical protein